MMFTLMGPRLLGIASDQINLIATTAIASTLAFGSISIFTLAQNIQGAPVGIIGIAIATASFPLLSRAFWSKVKDEFLHTFLESFRLILFFGIPLSLLFILLRAQIVRVVLGAGLFGWEDTRLSAATLGIFGISLFAQSLTPLLARAFYSMQDTKTPVYIGIGSVLANILLALAFVNLFQTNPAFQQFIALTLKLSGIPDIRVIALPLAFSLASIGGFLSLFIILSMRIGGECIGALNRSWFKMVVAAAVMAIVTYLSLRPLATLVDMTTGIGVFMQGLGAGIIGIALYFGITWFLGENPFISAKSEILTSKS